MHFLSVNHTERNRMLTVMAATLITKNK